MDWNLQCQLHQSFICPLNLRKPIYDLVGLSKEKFGGKKTKIHNSVGQGGLGELFSSWSAGADWVVLNVFWLFRVVLNAKDELWGSSTIISVGLGLSVSQQADQTLSTSSVIRTTWHRGVKSIKYAMFGPAGDLRILRLPQQFVAPERFRRSLSFLCHLCNKAAFV